MPLGLVQRVDGPGGKTRLMAKAPRARYGLRMADLLKPSTPSGPRDNVPLAVGTIICTVLALSLGDALIKALGGGGSVGLWRLFAVRSAIALPVLLIGALIVVPVVRLRPVAAGWIGVRSGLLTAMWIAYYASLPHLPLAVAAAAYYTLPLFIVVFAALFGGESVGRGQWSGVAIGFLGVLLVLRPGTDAFVPAAFLPLMAAMLYAGAMILTRTKCRAEHPATLALALNATFLLVGVLGLLTGMAFGWQEVSGFLSPVWVDMGTGEWLSVSILAALILIASVGTAIAYQNAPSSTVGTFDFAYVGFALIWGVLFFTERVDSVGFMGIVLIVLAGVLAVRGRPTRRPSGHRSLPLGKD